MPPAKSIHQRKSSRDLIRRLGKRWFLMRDVHATHNTLLQPRWALSFLRGPMTLGDVRRALQRGTSPPGAVPR